MADQVDVSRQALALPDVVAGEGQFGFGVVVRGKSKGFAWAWMERVDPKRAKVPNPEVLVVRVADLTVKEELLAADPSVYFTEPHYDGYRAVLVRLAAIDERELAELLTDAWLCTAPPALARQWEERLRSRHSDTGDSPLS
jgi:hypothetical protein